MLMPFGKHKNEPLHSIPESYLVWVVENCTRIRDDLRQAIRAELVNRRDPGHVAHARKEAYGESVACPPGDFEHVRCETIRLLLEAELDGVFPRGPKLDRLWELVALGHAEVARLRHRRFDYDWLVQGRAP
jgi:hypothetical protein